MVLGTFRHSGIVKEPLMQQALIIKPQNVHNLKRFKLEMDKWTVVAEKLRSIFGEKIKKNKYFKFY